MSAGRQVGDSVQEPIIAVTEDRDLIRADDNHNMRSRCMKSRFELLESNLKGKVIALIDRVVNGPPIIDVIMPGIASKG